MQQLTQKLGSGDMIIQELPIPQVGKGMILIKNYYSLISAGTEGSTVSTARKSLIGKAKERPQQANQVLQVLKQQGPVQTYRAVMKKLDAYSPLGYSCAGEVMEVGEGVTEFQPGDKVACAGVGYANHAEVVSVPKNLCVKLPSDANMKDAAYNTLGAISLQGVRQADLKLGEFCAVVGMGLLGQLAALMLKASGIRVIGIDISDDSIQLAEKNNSVDLALNRNASGIENKISEFSNGLGVDSVIIAAATSSNDPINFAGAIARKKGSIVILGDVPTGFARNPHWYKKELELKMACSYGPGRYDLNYEEKGIDYPAAYVRWTEKRNMEAFQHLIHSGSINLGYLTTHEFEFEEAPEAFDLVVNKTEPFIGITLKYDIEKEHQPEELIIREAKKLSDINISFIGAGSYAQGNLLPNIPVNKHINRIGILTNNGTTSKRVSEKFQFEFCTSKEEDVLDDRTNVLFIATPHHTHSYYVKKGLHQDKHIFVEKPLCLNIDELNEIKNLVMQKGKSIMVGFNRRFSPLSKMVKNKLGDGPMSMIYRVNAGVIPKDNWIQDMEMGGGRVIGEVCHFIDYLTFMNGSLPIKISAQALPDPHNLNDTLNILVQFENGSTGVVAYYANGAKSLSKEYIEIFRSGTIAIINDFKSVSIYGGRKTVKKKLINQDKGQKQMMQAMFIGFLEKGKTPISFNEIYSATKASFDVLKSIKTGGKLVNI